MKLIDNSGGIWANLLLRCKSPAQVLQNRFRPDPALMNALGSEAISSIRGSTKHEFAIYLINGQPRYHSFPSGRYPFGMLSNTTQEGKPFAPLADSTLRNRYQKGNKRGASFILRETSKHIYYGLKKLGYKRTKTRDQIEVGWDGENAEIVKLHERGFSTTNPMFNREVEKRAHQVPARKVRGFQEEFVRNYFNTLIQFLRPK